MARVEIALPLKGYSEGLQPHQQEPGTCQYCQNIRPRDVLDNRLRLGQRPGLKKAYSQQIGGVAAPITILLSVTTVD